MTQTESKSSCVQIFAEHSSNDCEFRWVQYLSLLFSLLLLRIVHCAFAIEAIRTRRFIRNATIRRDAAAANGRICVSLRSVRVILYLGYWSAFRFSPSFCFVLYVARVARFFVFSFSIRNGKTQSLFNANSITAHSTIKTKKREAQRVCTKKNKNVARNIQRHYIQSPQTIYAAHARTTTTSIDENKIKNEKRNETEKTRSLARTHIAFPYCRCPPPLRIEARKIRNQRKRQ